jgi:hypothetical protein
VHGEADLITQKTVFVLGAGASAPFGFQIGAELFDDVVNSFWTNTFRHGACDKHHKF